MPRNHEQEEWYLLRIFFSLSFRAWPGASKHEFRSFSGKSVFVFLSGRSPVSCVSESIYSTFKKTLLGAGKDSSLEAAGLLDEAPLPAVCENRPEMNLQTAWACRGRKPPPPTTVVSSDLDSPPPPDPALPAARVLRLKQKPDQCMPFLKIHKSFLFLSSRNDQTFKAWGPHFSFKRVGRLLLLSCSRLERP